MPYLKDKVTESCFDERFQRHTEVYSQMSELRVIVKADMKSYKLRMTFRCEAERSSSWATNSSDRFDFKSQLNFSLLTKCNFEADLQFKFELKVRLNWSQIRFCFEFALYLLDCKTATHQLQLTCTEEQTQQPADHEQLSLQLHTRTRQRWANLTQQILIRFRSHVWLYISQQFQILFRSLIELAPEIEAQPAAKCRDIDTADLKSDRKLLPDLGSDHIWSPSCFKFEVRT